MVAFGEFSDAGQDAHVEEGVSTTLSWAVAPLVPLVFQPQLHTCQVFLRDMADISDTMKVYMFRFNAEAPIVSVAQTLGASPDGPIVYYGSVGAFFPMGVFDREDEVSPLSLVAPFRAALGHRAVCIGFDMPLAHATQLPVLFPGVQCLEMDVEYDVTDTDELPEPLMDLVCQAEESRNDEMQHRLATASPTYAEDQQIVAKEFAELSNLFCAKLHTGPHIEHVQTPTTINISDYLDHPPIRIGLNGEVLQGPKSLDADTGIGGTTLYDAVCNIAPEVPFIISHGAKGSLHYQTVPRHGRIMIDMHNKQRLQFDVRGLMLGGMPKRDAAAADLDNAHPEEDSCEDSASDSDSESESDNDSEFTRECNKALAEQLNNAHPEEDSCEDSASEGPITDTTMTGFAQPVHINKEENNEVVLTSEPISIDSIEEVIDKFGSRIIKQDSDSDCNPFAGRTVADALNIFLDRVHHISNHGGTRVGWIYVGWKAPKFAAEINCNGRLNCGITSASVPEDHPMHQVMSRMLSKGFSTFQASCSPFALPRMLRNICRANLNVDGLVTADLDAQSMALNSVLHRRNQDSDPMDLTILKDVITNKRSRCAEVHTDYAIAKELINSLIFLGCVKSWTEKHGITHKLPSWVYKLAKFFVASATRDREQNPDKFEVCQNALAGDGRRRKLAEESKLVAWLNFDDEYHRVMNPVAAAITDSNTCVVSFEGDGHFAVGFADDPIAWRERLETMAGTIAPHSIKDIPALQETMASLDDWLGPCTPPDVSSVTGLKHDATLVENDVFILTSCDTDHKGEDAGKSLGPRAPIANGTRHGGFGRSFVILKSSCDNITDAHENLWNGNKGRINGSITSKFSDGVFVLVNKEENNSVKFPDEWSLLSIAVKPKDRTTNEKIKQTWQLFAGQPCISTMKLVTVQQEFDIPTFEEMQVWLASQSTRSFMTLTANAKRAVATEEANRYEICLIKTMLPECREYVAMLSECDTLIRKLTEQGHKRYPNDFLPCAPEMNGMTWDVGTGSVKSYTLAEVLDNGMYLSHTMFFVGKAGRGKSQLLHSLGRELTNRRLALDPSMDRYAFAKTLDPFGLLTKHGSMTSIACFCLTDLDLVSRIKEKLTFEEVKGLFKAEEAGTIPARYHVATFPEYIPMIVAVNSGQTLHGDIDFAQWFDEQNLKVLSYLINGEDISKFTEHELALARNCILFKCPDWLVEPPKSNAPLENTRQLAIHEALKANMFTL